ncbi:CWF19-like protein 2 isoform X2 [Thalassophryne amazonica]|uniref:CWF19-like protein 2 isoform X2 n=1 Tax=Thalassophryne amazonica TaxID=390379 RepID=UPI001471290D|nr:CWF19-like protein 2 isoform X2 [Thalassophryne amazonica]
MALNLVSFENANSIEERKEKKRQDRRETLEKAKKQYEKEERMKVLKRQRGEDTWMLPEINQRLQQIEEEVSVKSKKKSKKKKEKNKKKKAKKEKAAEDCSSENSEDSEEEWVEAEPHIQTANESKCAERNPSRVQDIQRDEWMNFDFLMKTTSTGERRAEKERLKEEERARARAIEQASLQKLELNPYWKDGGSGLPPEEMSHTAVKKGQLVNDGGLTWLRKSYQRMKEQAEREQRNLNDLVAERYGSMEQFQKRLADAEKAANAQTRREDAPAGVRWRKREDESKEKWRRTDRDWAERDRWRGHERERDSTSDREPCKREKDRERGGFHRNQDECREDRNRDRQRDGDSVKGKKKNRDGEKGRDEDGPRGPGWNRKPAEQQQVTLDHRDSSSSAQYMSQRSLSRGSLKACFIKPSEDDSGPGTLPLPFSEGHSKGFLKPGAGDDKPGVGNSRVPAWKKTSSLSLESNIPKEQKGDNAGKDVTVPPDSVQGDTAAAISSSEEEEEEEVQLMTDDDMNKLGAKLVKAEIMGDTAMAEKLKLQLEAARNAKENHATRKKLQEKANSKQVPGHSSEDQEVLLFRTDQSGRAWPVNTSSGPQEPHGGRRKKKLIETHVDGKRVRYFEGDDRLSLQEMVRREMMSSAQDQNSLYSRMAAKMMGKTDSDNYTLDDMFVSSVAQREGEGREEERMRNRAIGESRKLAASMEKCRHCFTGQELQKHLIVAIGNKVYLSLPAGVSMSEGHCLICPLQHHCSATGLDEDICYSGALWCVCSRPTIWTVSSWRHS